MEAAVRAQIKKLVIDKVEAKLDRYAAESEYKPFFEAIFDKQTIVTASIVQSIYTSFGMSLYEQIAKVLATSAGYTVTTPYDLQGCIDPQTEGVINELLLEFNRTPDKKTEIEIIRKSIRAGTPKLDDTEKRVDVFIIKPDSEELYVDITTVKSNLKEFRALKRKLLRWCALRFSQNPNAKIKTCIGLPYNPYYPENYERWTAKICEPKEDILVQNDLWREFAGYDVFPELIELFQEVGADLRDKISDFLRNRI